MRKIDIKNLIILLLIASNFTMAASYFGFKWARGERSSEVSARKSAKKVAQQRPSPEGIVRSALRKKMSHVEMCYERYLSTEPEKPIGSIQVQWLVEPNGQVSSPEIQSSEFKSTDLADCLVEEIKTWSFASHASLEPIQVAHRFTFKQKNPSSLNFEDDL